MVPAGASSRPGRSFVRQLFAISMGFAWALPTVATADDPEMEAVVVTGSRIRGAASAVTAPVTTIAREQLLTGANDSLGRILQALPYNSGSAPNTNVNNGGDGAVRLDLRALGPQRTLVLLNGRRLPNGGIGGDSSVDIDSLPLSMVDRVEVLTTGASAIYGADAIGGVVNVITRRDVDGLEMVVQRSQSELGDGAISRAQITGGIDTGDGHWMLGIDRVEQQGVLQGEREYSAVPLAVESVDGARVYAGTPNNPQGRFRVPGNNTLGLPAGIYTHVDGTNGHAASDYRLYTDDDAFNYAPYNFLQTPNTRSSLWVGGNQPLGDGVELVFEGLARRRESSQKLAPTPFTVVDGFAPPNAVGVAVVPADNYYNPFGVNLARPVARRLVELADRGYQQRVDVWRALLGLRGEMHAWSWELSFAESRSKAVTHETGAALGERTTRALGPSGLDGAGHIVCGAPDPTTGTVPAADIIPDCVPLDLFGGAGSISADQLGFISTDLEDHGRNDQRVLNVGATGSWLHTPAGLVQWAVGAEWRRESGAYDFDPLRASGTAGQGLNADIPGGSFDVREVYVEARAPLLASDSRVGALMASAGVRHSHFSNFGDDDTWRAGLRWEPSGVIALRAEYARLLRAPSLQDLFEAQSTGPYGSATDPCQDPTPVQRVNCAANGVPGGSYERTEIFYDLTAGGDPTLQPESGDSFDAGIELHADDKRWSASVDYFRTRLDGYMSPIDDVTLLQECADGGTAQACSRIHRFEDGSLQRIDMRTSNLGNRFIEGFDAAARGNFDGAAGHFSAHLLVTNLASVRTRLFDGGTTEFDRAGFYFDAALPKWRALGGVDWQRDRWTASYNLQWIGDFTNCSLVDDGEYCARVDHVLYHDVEAGFEAFTRLTLRFGVNNLTDEQPPFVNTSDANTDTATYRLLGRLWFVQFEYDLRP